MNDGDDFIRDFLERLGFEHACLGNEKALMCGEEFGWSGITHEPKAALLEIIVREFDGASVRIWLARDLTESNR